ncbi:hypothetical protein DL96DRAFT_150547 [Flagelloscypha sp. PMI_526]|nr:hypothetical protein DL96DRAFT_150547 [Flagelloscypha sp. PMI_526]
MLHHDYLHDVRESVTIKTLPISNNHRIRTRSITPHTPPVEVIIDSPFRRCKRNRCLNHVPSHLGWVFCEQCRLDIYGSRRGKKSPSQSPFVCVQCKLPKHTPVGGYTTCDSCRSRHAKISRECRARQRQLSLVAKLEQTPTRLSHVPTFLFTPSPTPLPSEIRPDSLSLGDDNADRSDETPPPAHLGPARRSLSGIRPLSQTTTGDVSEEQVDTEQIGSTMSDRQYSTPYSRTALHTTSAPASEFVTLRLPRTVAEMLLKQLKMSGVEVKTEDESSIE